MKQLCKCGCKQVTSGKWNPIKKQYTQFVHGHHITKLHTEGKINHLKGEDHPMFGKPHTGEAKEKIRQAALKQFKDGMPKKTREKISRLRKGVYPGPLRKWKEENGGSWIKGRTHTVELKKKWSKDRKDKTYEQRFGPERAKKIKQKMKETRMGKQNNFYGKQHKEKTKRKISATKQNMGLEEWREFISYKPYTLDFNKQFKYKIKERDGCCILCNIGFEDLYELKRKIHVHHIDYDKLNSFPQNCITLCNKCHGLTQKNRDQWKIFFQNLLKERYEYTENQKIIINFDKISKN